MLISVIMLSVITYNRVETNQPQQDQFNFLSSMRNFHSSVTIKYVPNDSLYNIFSIVCLALEFGMLFLGKTHKMHLGNLPPTAADLPPLPLAYKNHTPATPVCFATETYHVAFMVVSDKLCCHFAWSAGFPLFYYKTQFCCLITRHKITTCFDVLTLTAPSTYLLANATLHILSIKFKYNCLKIIKGHNNGKMQ